MKKSILVAVSSAMLVPFAGVAQTAAPAEAPAASPFTGNFTIASEYLYRGIAQTRGKPALQGGFDYAHPSGLYAGLWGSNITWIGDGVAGASAGLELDVYGGYKGTLSGDLGYDIGVLTYNYPGSGKTVPGVQDLNQDTTELYGAVTWKWLTLKYSHSTSALFGWAKSPGLTTDKTTGSSYLELNATYDLGDGWGLTGHIGNQKVKGNSNASYSDYKVGFTKDIGYGVVGVAYSTTDAKDSCTNNAPTSASDVYCFAKAAGPADAYASGQGRLLLTFGKTF